nr:hypothetical protein [Desulfogranum marinum]
MFSVMRFQPRKLSRKVRSPNLFSDGWSGASQFVQFNIHHGPSEIILYRASLVNLVFPIRLRSSARQKKQGATLD